MASPLVYSSRARWCASRSLLGHVFRRSIENERQAEAWYLIMISSVVVAAIVMQFMAWSFWHEEIQNSSRISMWYWGIQLGVAGLVFIGGFLGYCPRVRASLTESSLSVSQGRRSVELDLSTLTDCRIVSALQYYRKWDCRVEGYMAHIPEDVLLVLGERQSIAIGISPDAHARLLVEMNRLAEINAV